MGWYGTNENFSNKKEFLQSEFKSYVQDNGNEVKNTILKSSPEGYILTQVYAPNGVILTQIITVALVSKSNGEWAYKPIDETMGPIKNNVAYSTISKYPLIINGLEIKDNKYSNEWREAVKAKSSVKAVKLGIGSMIRFDSYVLKALGLEDIEYKILAKASAKTWKIDGILGYRFAKSNFAI